MDDFIVYRPKEYHQLEEENKMAVDRALYSARESMKKEMICEAIKQLDERVTRLEKNERIV